MQTSNKNTKYMERAPAICNEAPHGLFMCSKLYIAAFEGRTDEITGLLTGSSDVTAAEGNGWPSPRARENAIHPGPCCSTREVTAERSTLLHIAAGQGHVDLIAELCLRDSALLSLVNSSLDTPLHCSARAGKADAVEAIIRLALDNVEEDRLRGFLGWKNQAGDTALHLAARHGHGATVETLMNLAPELASEVNAAGVSPLYLAVMSRSVRGIAAIVWYRDASAAGPMSQNALHAAVLQSSEMVSLLLRWRPTLATDLDSNKSSPLHFASSDGDCSIVQEVLTYAPPSTPYLQDREGLSALHAAALMGNGPAVRLLLQFYPASADIRDNNGRSFLHAAAMQGHSSIVSHVIKNRMLEHLLNEQDMQGNTALHLAVQAGEYKVVSKLLYSGKVQAHIMNNAGLTPSDLIENSTSFYSMVRLLVKLYVYGAQFRPQRQDHIKKWAGQDIVKWRVATSKNLAIVSTLVATVAFSAAFNVPGSYGSDGKANLNGNRMYTAFLVLDTIAVTTAVMATILLVYGRASRSQRSWLSFIVSMHFLWLSLLSMMLGFFTAIAATSDKKYMRTALSRLIYSGTYILITVLTSLFMPGSLRGVLQFLLGGFSEQQRHVKRRINRQYPFIVMYSFNIILLIVISNIALAAVDTTGNLS
ncbi:protein ACCELERATED CELL DEATH 6-like isoform X2 [Phragmites australis]|uniref:protein ACCELERATED CELL DEATH 6-like isoform X2 n=1 Tax=Phragmites australis TaxID=29695 RepID=UPI002D798B16|nr:protein ACCELERATED CELL DEATH 6-like isoform X2 [Phragmites australis]